MNSDYILEQLKSSLDTYLTANYNGAVPYIIETYPLNLDLLDGRSDIPGLRIGISESSDDSQTFAEDTKVLDTEQGYEFQLFFRIGREKDTYEQAEKLMIVFKDLIFNWVFNSLDPGAISNNELVTFNWAGSDQPIRDRKFTSMNINFISLRNLLS